MAIIVGNQAIQRCGSDTEEEPSKEEHIPTKSTLSESAHLDEHTSKAVETICSEAEPDERVVDSKLRAKVAELAPKTKSPAVSAVYNKRRRKIYCAQNDVDIPSSFAEPIRSRIETICTMPQKDRYKNTTGPGHHAEVIAANAAMESDNECDFSDLVVCTVRAKGKPKRRQKKRTSDLSIGSDFSTCPDCEYILYGSRIITGDATGSHGASYIRFCKGKRSRLPTPCRCGRGPRLSASPMPVLSEQLDDAPPKTDIPLPETDDVHEIEEDSLSTK